MSKGYSSTVDDDDYEMLSQYKWYCGNGYAVRDEYVNRIRHTYYMHRFITNAPHGYDVDHINGNRLDNRRENLRVCLHIDNMSNRGVTRNKQSSNYKGVYRGVGVTKFHARIKADGIRYYLGSFNTEIEAAETYDKAARYYFGEYAKLNFDNESYGE